MLQEAREKLLQLSKKWLECERAVIAEKQKIKKEVDTYLSCHSDLRENTQKIKELKASWDSFYRKEMRKFHPDRHVLASRAIDQNGQLKVEECCNDKVVEIGRHHNEMQQFFEDKQQALTEKEEDPLHELAKILAASSIKHRIKVLSDVTHFVKFNSSWLHDIAEKGYADVLEGLFEGMSVDQRLSLLKQKAGKKYFRFSQRPLSVLGIACLCGHPSMVTAIMRSVPSPQRCELLLQPLGEYDTPAFYDIIFWIHSSYRALDVIRAIFASLSEEDRLPLIKYKDKRTHHTALHWAVFAHNGEVLKEILRNVPEMQRLQLMTQKDWRGQSPLKEALGGVIGKYLPGVLTVLLDSLPRKQAVKLLNHRCGLRRNTVLHLMATSPNLEDEQRECLMNIIIENYRCHLNHCFDPSGQQDLASVNEAVLSGKQKKKFPALQKKYQLVKSLQAALASGGVAAVKEFIKKNKKEIVFYRNNKGWRNFFIVLSVLTGGLALMIAMLSTGIQTRGEKWRFWKTYAESNLINPIEKICYNATNSTMKR